VVDDTVIMDRQSTIQNDYKLKVLDILKTQDKKTAFANLRQLLADNAIRDYSDCFRLLYDNVDEFAAGNMAAVILILARYEQSDMQVVDKEINFMAMLIELLGVIK
jgi:hypothetical protein